MGGPHFRGLGSPIRVYRFEISKPWFWTRRSPAVRHGPIYFFLRDSVAPWCAFAFWLRLRRAAFSGFGFALIFFVFRIPPYMSHRYRDLSRIAQFTGALARCLRAAKTNYISITNSLPMNC